MKKNFIYRFLISFLIVLVLQTSVLSNNKQRPTFVSLSPALTEIIYAIGAQDMLLGVSTACSYPHEAKNKSKIGDNFFINTEVIIKIKPDYILALDSSAFMLKKFEQFGIVPLCFEYPNIQSIYENILKLGNLTQNEAKANNIVNKLKQNIQYANKKHNHKILYLVQVYPMITIGKKSFITDIIDKSGNSSVTKDIDEYYPIISEEFAVKSAPDVIILSFYSDTKRLKELFPNTKIIYMSQEENDIINRPGVRIDKSVEFFAQY